MLLNAKSRKTALIENDKRTSFYTLAQKAISIARRLTSVRQKKVAIYLPDGSAFIYALCGIIMSGKIAFPININYTYSELADLLNFVHPTIITSKQYGNLFEKYQNEHKFPISIIYIEDIAQNDPHEKFEVERYRPQSPVLLLNTSGTTGKPKIVMLSVNNIEACIEGYLAKMDFKLFKGSKYILASPFTSAYGLMIIFACLKIQYALVILKSPFSITNFLHTAEKYQVTLFEGGSPVIRMLWQLSKANSQIQFQYPLYYGFGGSKISSIALQELKANHPQLEFWPGYGMTEASPLISKNQVVKTNPNYDTVGTAIQGETIRILHHDKLTDMPNITGEIVVKGKNIMLGYYKNRTETKKVFNKGYLYTGDIGYLDEDNHLYIVGRKKNIVIVRGMNVSVEEVENTLINSGYVEDCIVYSQKDAMENEMLCAKVIPISKNIDKQTIIDYCSTHLANYKVPHTIYIVDTIEKTFSGKNKV